MMEFFIPMDKVPRTTAQQKRMRVVRGKPVFFKSQKQVAEHTELAYKLAPYRPKQPLDGPVALHVRWCFPTKQRKLEGTWKVTRPDTDNLNKALKDIMTGLGFWHDDSQVVAERIEKVWSVVPGIMITIEALGDAYEVQYV